MNKIAFGIGIPLVVVGSGLTFAMGSISQSDITEILNPCMNETDKQRYILETGQEFSLNSEEKTGPRDFLRINC